VTDRSSSPAGDVSSEPRVPTNGLNGAVRVASSPSARSRHAPTMKTARSASRGKLDRTSKSLLAMAGIVGLATVLGAVLVSLDVAGWIVGLTVGLMSVAGAARFWSSRLPNV
jgi:hypothetical protein